MSRLELTVNGRHVVIDVPESRFLSDVLREDLRLTGTKVGCAEAECGICTVLVDGTPVVSCVYPAFKADGRKVETIEGLAGGGKLHALQQAFLDHGAVQCGICTPGMLMTAKGLLDRHAVAGEPVTEADVRAALKDTYCRCTGYQAIVNAILQAAGHDVPPYVPPTRESGRVVGRPLPNPNALAKITGAARFADDYHFDGMLCGRTLRAGIPHARILSIDVSRARALDGVHAVLTHDDVPGRNAHGIVSIDWPVLCGNKVRYAGDAVAIVAADSPEIAEAALALIDVDYEELPAVTDPLAALAPDAPRIHEQRPDGNLLKHIKVRKGDLAAAFGEADVIIDRTYRTPTTEHLFLEPECSIGIPAGYPAHDKTTVYVGSQIPYADRDQVAAALGIDAERVRIRATLMGGGFGGKEDITGQIHAALLAEATGRPVKMRYSRQESLLVHPKRHAMLIRMRTGATREGRLVAVHATLYGDGGAYASLSDKVLTRATTHATGPYAVPAVRVDCFSTYTNNVPAGAFRGFGVTQSCFAAESNMDALAAELGIDPVELRRRNALTQGATTATGQVLRESVGLVECIDRVDGEYRRDGFRWSWDEGDVRCAWGFAVGYKNTGLGGGAPDKATAEIEAWRDATGNVAAQVRISSAEMGQGLPGVLAAIAAEELGAAAERIDVLLGDTDLCPDGGPTTASRQTYVSGNAVRHAAREAAQRLADDPDGRFVTRYEYWAPRTRPLGTGGDMHVGFSFAAQAALCEVDRRSGEVRVRQVVAAHDVGRAINPLTLEGQIEGGIVMAMGFALTEHYIQEDGRPWTRFMARYKTPGAEHAPRIVSHIVEDPLSTGPFGAKGMGELPSIPTAAAITNAICNATGVRVRSLPVDQDALLRAMASGAAESEFGWGDREPIPEIEFA